LGENVLLWKMRSQRGRPRKTWKEVVDKDMNDLHIKLSDDIDHSTWRRMI